MVDFILKQINYIRINSKMEGTDIMKNISFSPPDITEGDVKSVSDTLYSGWITTGPKCKEFEKAICNYLHADNCCLFNSATSALEITLRMLGIGPGDEVITSAYTYTATASVIDHVGAKIVFLDTKKDSYELDYNKLPDVITEKTKAVIPVDIAGKLCHYETILPIVEANSHHFKPANDIQKAIGRIAVISDSAHGFGSTRTGKMSGTLADFTAFSFHAVKNLTTCEGGAITWNNIKGIDSEKLYKNYMLMCLHGQTKDAFSKSQLGSWEYDIMFTGYKCNMTDTLASLGLSQLSRYDSLISRRKEIVRRYSKMCDDLKVEYMHHFADNFESNCHLFLTRIPGISELERNDIISEMAKNGITCNVHFKPLPMMTAYKNLGFDIKDFPNAYEHYKNEISLPLHTLLSDDDVDYVIDCFTKIIKARKK